MNDTLTLIISFIVGLAVYNRPQQVMAFSLLLIALKYGGLLEIVLKIKGEA